MKNYLHASELTIAAVLILAFTPGHIRADILYVGNGATIDAYDSSGNGSVFANTGANGIAFSSAGNLYGLRANGVYSYDSSGTASLYANNLGFFSGTGCAFDNSGNLYVSVLNSDTIVKYNTSGVGSTFASTGTGNPFGIAFDTAGNLYVACLGNNSIEKITPGGVESVFASGGLLIDPVALAFDGNGNLFVVNQGGGMVKFSPRGVGSVFGSANLTIYSEGGIAFDSSGNLYVSDYVNKTIDEFSSSGVESTFASGGLLTGPRFLAFTSDNGTPLALPVPEPSAIALFGLGSLLFLWRKRTACTARF